MLKTILRSPAITVLLFVMAAALLGFGTVGAVQAAPSIQSHDYQAEVRLTNIGTALTEYSESETQKNEVTGDETHFITRENDDFLLRNLLKDANDDQFKIGKEYSYKLAVRNVANNGIDQHVRVTVQKFWVLTDDEGNPLTHDGSKQGKAYSLDPSLIELHFVEKGDERGHWTIDEDASTDERTVLYYSGKLKPGDDSPNFTDKLTINGKVVTDIKHLADGSDQFNYEGVQFRIKATVDAVQTHNGEAALDGTWGQHQYVEDIES